MTIVGESQVSLAERELDALREMANIGCGHAATALSRLVGDRRVVLEVPRSELLELDALLDQFGGREAPVVAVALDVNGALTGRLMLLMAPADARALAGLLLGQEPATGRLAEESASALCEVANILGSACLNAIGRTLNMKLIPTVPRIAQDMAGAVLGEAVSRFGERSDCALVLETRFSSVGDPSFAGHLLVMPDLPSLPATLQAMGF